MYAPTLVKALQGKDVALIRSGQHHTLALTHAGELRSGAGLGGAVLHGVCSSRCTSWAGLQLGGLQLGGLQQSVCRTRTRWCAASSCQPARLGPARQVTWTVDCIWRSPAWLVPPIAGTLLSFGRPTYGRLGQKDADVAADAGGELLRSSPALPCTAGSTPGLQPAHANLPNLTRCAYSYARTHSASASVRWVSSEHVRPSRFAPMHSLPRAQGSGRPGGRQGRGRSGRAGGVR